MFQLEADRNPNRPGWIHQMLQQGNTYWEDDAKDLAKAGRWEGLTPEQALRSQAGFAERQWSSGRSDFSDPVSRQFKEYFRPDVFYGQYMQTPEAQAYMNVSDRAQALGVGTQRAGEQQNINQTRQEAANLGLGRGYANKASADIRQAGTEGAANTMLSAQMEEDARRSQVAATFANMLVEANRSVFAAHLQRKMAKKASNAGLLGMIGQIAGGVGSLAGAFVGGPAGAAVGGAAGQAIGGQDAGRSPGTVAPGVY